MSAIILNKSMALAVFLISFAFYLFNLAPSITVGDAAELIASCKILGINHAPGYPLFSLLGKISTALLSFGSIAYRVNLMSALFGSATVLTIFFILRKQFDSKKSAAAALLLAVSFSFAQASVQTVVSTLNSFFAALIILLSLKTERVQGGFSHWYLISFLFGLGMGNHHTLILVGPAVFYIFLTNRPRFISLSFFLKLFLIFMIGFSVYLYLPIRSVKDPGFDVGNPDNLERIFRVIRRADYGTLRLTVGEKQPYSAEVIFRQFIRIFEGLNRQFTAAGLILAIIGLVFLFKTNLRLAVFFSLLYLFSVPFFIFMGNLPFNAESEGILDRFYVLGNIPLLFMIFYGGGFLGSLIKLKNTQTIIFWAVILFIVMHNRPYHDWRNNFLAHDYGKNLLKSLEPGAAFFMDGGDDTFYSMGYFVFARRLRQDISLFDRGGVVFHSAYGSDFRRLPRDERERRRKSVEAATAEKRVVAFSTFNRDIMSPKKVYPLGILYSPNKKKNLFHFYSSRNLFDRKKDYRSHALQPLYFFLGAQFAAEPLQYLSYTAKRWPDVAWAQNNIGIELTNTAYQLFMEGKLAQARQLYKMLIEKFPNNAYNYVNLGVIAERKGNDIEALEYYRKAMNADPSHAIAYYNTAVLYWKKSDWQNVVYYFNKVLELEPRNEQAIKYLQIARQRILIK